MSFWTQIPEQGELFIHISFTVLGTPDKKASSAWLTDLAVKTVLLTSAVMYVRLLSVDTEAIQRTS